MRPLLLVIAMVGVTAALLFIAFGGMLFPKPPSDVDTETHSLTVVGYYGEGTFAGELLQSSEIRSNVTAEGYSQSVVVQGRVCATDSSGGRIFLNGAKSTEPDALYEYRLNGVIVFTSNIEVGDSSALTACLDFPRREAILTGQNTGIVRVNLLVYVTSLLTGTGKYELLGYDQAVLV